MRVVACFTGTEQMHAVSLTLLSGVRVSLSAGYIQDSQWTPGRSLAAATHPPHGRWKSRITKNGVGDNVARGTTNDAVGHRRSHD